MVIRRISPMSCAKVCGLLYAVIGFLIGACFTLVMVTIGSVLPQDEQRMGAFFGALFGGGAILILPIFYGVLGFIGGAIVAAVYNLIAGWTGGIEIDVQ
jgi:hypothetical protein